MLRLVRPVLLSYLDEETGDLCTHVRGSALFSALESPSIGSDRA
jgi:hypothetical protein